MAKETRQFSSWIEVAPALLVSSKRIRASTSPALETITEDEAEELDQHYSELCMFWELTDGQKAKLPNRLVLQLRKCGQSQLNSKAHNGQN
ncbi:hypothetical protein GQ457_06G008420 [Hibiscus cannabinus]